MSSNIQIFLFCPVPENQKPINELINFQENPLNNWILLPKKNYQKKLAQIYFLFFLLFSFSYPPNFHLFSFLLRNIIITNFIFLTIFFLLFFRLSQLENRFNLARLFYEEGSWYDGQIWEKPLFVIKNDRLVTTQKIQPIIQRISRTILLFFYPTIFLLAIFSF
jgi:hypothetical protein